ncbi:hypothetical protein JCM11641_005593 [Rhodosporidiobolus odoratus]
MEGPHRGEEKQEETLDLAPFFLKNASLRSAALHFVAYLVLGSQNASRARVQPVRVAALVFLPLVTALATGVLQFALSTASFDFFAASTAYYASTAFLLVTLLFLGINPSHIVSRMYLVIMIPHIVLYALCRYFAAATGDLPKSAPAHTPLSPSPAASTSTPSVRTVRIIAALAILFPISWYIHLANTLHTVDLVFAHYSMPLNDLRSHIEVIKAARLVNTSRTRVIIYEKGEFTDEQLWEALAGVAQEGWDEIVHLPNYAREGGTYLEHIVTRYNDTLPGGPRRFSVEAAKHHGQRLWRKKRPIADHTLFMQSHLAWHWLAGPRLANALHRNTGFLSFGPYLSNLCGSDSEGTGFYPGAKSIYKEVLGKECTEGKEEDRVLSTWAGQFAVSRERVMSNGWEVYEKMREWIEAPNDDPLHHLWNPSGPSTQDNPAFGHSLERSWPLVFRCLDPKIAKECPEAEFAASATAFPALSASTSSFSPVPTQSAPVQRPVLRLDASSATLRNLPSSDFHSLSPPPRPSHPPPTPSAAPPLPVPSVSKPLPSYPAFSFEESFDDDGVKADFSRKPPEPFYAQRKSHLSERTIQTVGTCGSIYGEDDDSLFRGGVGSRTPGWRSRAPSTFSKTSLDRAVEKEEEDAKAAEGKTDANETERGQAAAESSVSEERPICSPFSSSPLAVAPSFDGSASAPSPSKIWSYRLNRYVAAPSLSRINRSTSTSSTASTPSMTSTSSLPVTFLPLSSRQLETSPARLPKTSALSSSPSHLSPRGLFGTHFLRRGLSVASQDSESTAASPTSEGSVASGAGSVAGWSPVSPSGLSAAEAVNTASPDAADHGTLSRTYTTKNLSLTVSPPLDFGRFSPGQRLQLTLSLGPKVSLSSFESIEVKLVGSSLVPGEPPEHHDFLVLAVSILTPSPMVAEVGLGQRTFTIDLQLPLKQTCDCFSPALDIPSSWTHQHFRTRYTLELNAKRTGTFGKSERIIETLAVHAPPPSNVMLLNMSSPLPSSIAGQDGEWLTALTAKRIFLTDSPCRLTSGQLAWKIQSDPGAPSIARIPYRVTLHFASLPAPEPFLAALEDSGIKLTISRRIILRNRKTGVEEPLPAIVVPAKELGIEHSAGIVGGRWVQTGELEVSRLETKSITTCAISVRYILTARLLPSVGLSSTLEIQARGLNLDYPATAPPVMSHALVLASSQAASPVVTSPISDRSPSTSIPRFMAAEGSA